MSSIDKASNTFVCQILCFYYFARTWYFYEWTYFWLLLSIYFLTQAWTLQSAKYMPTLPDIYWLGYLNCSSNLLKTFILLQKQIKSYHNKSHFLVLKTWLDSQKSQFSFEIGMEICWLTFSKPCLSDYMTNLWIYKLELLISLLKEIPYLCWYIWNCSLVNQDPTLIP